MSTLPSLLPDSAAQDEPLLEETHDITVNQPSHAKVVATESSSIVNRSLLEDRCKDKVLGQGRSGVVFRSRDADNRETARKVFGASGLTKIVQYAFLGAPNPYMWCESAAKAAFLRRRILSELVHYWFGPKLRVAHAYDYGWNDQFRAFELRCELISGRHVALQHGQLKSENEELQEITKHIMQPLQQHLIESGFDGLVWQAGLGNPVALNNFMCCSTGEDRARHWAWIDLESGVPSLIPMNPLSLFSFYLPKSFHHRRPLFDDVDMDKLKRYLKDQATALSDQLGDSTVRQLEIDVDRLCHCQEKWKSLSRLEGSIKYQTARGSINHTQAQWYAAHPDLWYKRELGRVVTSIPSRISHVASYVFNRLANIKIGRLFKSSWTALRSQVYREFLMREYVSSRINAWTDRNQLRDDQAQHIRRHLDAEETNSYMTDFGVHVAIKPLVKLLQFWIMPLLWMGGIISPALLAIFVVAGGSIIRTGYTLVRILQNTLTKRERPWVALIVGIVPVVGNLAFPAQIAISGAKEDRTLAQFIMHDTCSRLGQWLPIWGGQDTMTEHVMNRLPHFFLRMSASADNT